MSVIAKFCKQLFFKPIAFGMHEMTVECRKRRAHALRTYQSFYARLFQEPRATAKAFFRFGADELDELARGCEIIAKAEISYAVFKRQYLSFGIKF